MWLHLAVAVLAARCPLGLFRRARRCLTAPMSIHIIINFNLQSTRPLTLLVALPVGSTSNVTGRGKHSLYFPYFLCAGEAMPRPPYISVSVLSTSFCKYPSHRVSDCLAGWKHQRREGAGKAFLYLPYVSFLCRRGGAPAYSGACADHRTYISISINHFILQVPVPSRCWLLCRLEAPET